MQKKCGEHEENTLQPQYVLCGWSIIAIQWLTSSTSMSYDNVVKYTTIIATISFARNTMRQIETCDFDFSSLLLLFFFLLSFVLILVSVFFRLPQKVSLRARAIVYSFFRFSVRSSAVQFHCYPLVNFRRMTFIHRTIVLRRFSPFQIHNTQRCMGSNGWQHNRNERSAQHLRSIFSLK